MAPRSNLASENSHGPNMQTALPYAQRPVVMWPRPLDHVVTSHRSADWSRHLKWSRPQAWSRPVNLSRFILRSRPHDHVPMVTSPRSRHMDLCAPRLVVTAVWSHPLWSHPFVVTSRRGHIPLWSYPLWSHAHVSCDHSRSGSSLPGRVVTSHCARVTSPCGHIPLWSHPLVCARVLASVSTP